MKTAAPILAAVLGISLLHGMPGSAAGKSPTAAKTVPFIADDYAKALAEARAKKLPLFIETWAPW